MIAYLSDYHAHWSILLGVSILLWCSQWVAPRFGKIPAALFCYAMLSAIWVWAWKDNRYLPLNPYDQMALRYFAADSLAKLVVVIVPLMLLAENISAFELLGKILVGTFIVLNSSWALYSFFKTGCVATNSCGGAGNPSIMLGLSVSALPVVIQDIRRQWYLLLLVALAALVSKSSIAIILLAIYGALSLPPLYGYALAVIAPIAGFYFIGGVEFFSSGDRFQIWQYMMPKWAAPANLAAGTGLGTYHVFSIHLQNFGKVAEGYYWNTLHNDWLQMLFEGGIAGMALMIGSYFSALWRMIRAKEMGFALSIVLFGIYMGVNPALHHALPVLFAAWLFIYALKRKPNNHPMKEFSYA